MLHRKTGIALTAMAGLMLAMTVAAYASAPAKDNGKTTETMEIWNAVSLAGTQLKPGSYVVTAADSKVTLALNGKVVAEASVQWKDRASKARSSTIVASDGKIKEIHFAGKARYLEVGS
jgi:hypothetical protein